MGGCVDKCKNVECKKDMWELQNQMVCGEKC
jgi:hypothetical protein